MKPLLVIQMQRMGDLILTFPLLVWLKRRYPGQRILVVAEPQFFRELAPLSPGVEYVSFANHAAILPHEYSLVINLSHRREAAWLAGKVGAEEKIGPFLDSDENLYIQGKWQLYRASLVRNNRYNMFHWADLNALDSIGLDVLTATSWPAPRRLPPDNKKIGIFLGASQKEKRPTPEFWAELVHALVDRGMRPVLLGGPGEKDLGRAVVVRAGVPVLNLVGTTSLQQFARIGHTLQLMITPDTGPMHLAAWSGLQTLNLSMGPVNSWETGPYHPGHYVLRTTMSCSGCWVCRNSEPLCVKVFNARRVASCAHEIMRGRENNLAKFVFPGLELGQTSRRNGLYALHPLSSPHHIVSSRYVLAHFWRSFWGYHFGLWDKTSVCNTAETLASMYPWITRKMREHTQIFLHEVKKRVLSPSALRIESSRGGVLPALRPCTGYCQLILENGNYSRPAIILVLSLLEDLLVFLK